MPTALVLGCNGQDGSYITDILLAKEYDVVGTIRHSSQPNLSRIQHNLDNPLFRLHQADITDVGSLVRVIRDARPDEIYNEADQDHVGYSYSTPAVSIAVTAGGVSNLLEAVRDVVGGVSGNFIKIFQPISAVIFGNAPAPQTEKSPINPLSPYACAKAHAYHLCLYYRQCYGMHVSTAIMYNHDSPRRGRDYLLQKICRTAVRISLGSTECLELDRHLWGSVIDIGYAKDYMYGAWQLLQYPEPIDVILSGNYVTVKALTKLAFDIFRIDVEKHIKPTEEPFRPGPKTHLVGDRTLAENLIRYSPNTFTVDLIKMLIVQAQKEEIV